MNTQSSGMPESFDAQKVVPLAESSARPFYWSVRRELWENRFVYIAPVAIAAVFLFGFLITTFQLPGKMRGLSTMDPAHYHEVIAMPYDFAAGLMMLATILVSVFYCVDALHGERRDRSVLFWKSLPVSDRTTVLAKASIPLAVVPLLTFAVAVTMQFVMLLLSSAVLVASGLSMGTLWSQLSFLQMSWLLLYHLVTAHTLWPAPVYCWLLFVSSWARRAVFLWATLPLIAIAGLEKIAFNSTHFALMLGSRLIGGAENTTMSSPNMFPTNPMTHITPGRFLASPGLWLGLIVAAMFLAGAVRLRRDRGPI